MSEGCCGADCGCHSMESTGTSSVSNNEVALRSFGQFMRDTAVKGAIDERTKELITVALVILSKCEPCLEVHFDKALKTGISKAEIDEAAWLAIAMGGAPVKMFYFSWLKKNGF